MTGKIPKKKDRPGVDRYGRTPLHHAAADGNEKEVARLLSEGSDANAKDDDNWMPLHFATQANSVLVASQLLSAGAEVDPPESHGNTPLSKAVFNSKGDGKLITLLREAGADPFRKNNHGVSPVGLARMIANYDVAKFFDDLPADQA
jgi:uncharacterized protein